MDVGGEHRTEGQRGSGDAGTLSERLGELCQLAAQVCSAPIAFLTSVDGNVRSLAATFGLGREFSNNYASAIPATEFGERIVDRNSNNLIVLDDTSTDARVATSPLVTGAPGLRFAAVAVLRTDDDNLIGTLCIGDCSPRSLTTPQRQSLLVIAAQMVAQFELDRCRRRLRLALAHSRDPNLGVDHHGNIVTVDDQVERMFGRSKQQLLGQPLKALVHPADQGALASALTLASSAANAGVVDATYRIIRPDGMVRWVHERSTISSDGRSGELEDDTIRRNLEDRLRLGTRTLSDISSGRPFVVVMTEFAAEIEALLPTGRVVIATASANQYDLARVIAPSMDESYVQNLSAVQLDPNAGVISATIVGGERIMVEHVGIDSRWPSDRVRAAAHDIGATWVVPIVDSTGKPTAALAIHLRRPSAPTANDLALMQRAAVVIGLALEADRRATALRQNDENYQLLFAQNPMPMWVHDAISGEFLAVNNAALDHYGYSRTEFLALSLADLRPAGPAPWPLGEVCRTPNTPITGPVVDGDQGPGLWRHRLKDGRLRWVDVSTQALTFEDRAARLVLCSDVTAQVDAEQRLRASQASLVEAQGLAHVGSWELDISSGALRWSGELANIYGVSRPSRGTPSAALAGPAHPADRAQVEANVLTTLAGGGRLDMTHRIVRPNGEVRWVHQVAEVELDGTGRPGRVAGTVLDITDRTHAAQLLEYEARMLRTLAMGQPLNEFVTEVASYLEEIFPGGMVVIRLVNAERTKMIIAAAPSMPDSFHAEVKAVDLAALLGTSGMAAATRKPAFAEDVCADPAWQSAHAFAREFNLAAAWSVPLLDTNGEIDGTLSLVFRTKGLPDDRERDILLRMANVLGIAIGRDRTERISQANAERYRAMFRDAAMGITTVDRAGAFLFHNAAFASMLGYTSHELEQTTLHVIVHPDERGTLETLLTELFNETRDSAVVELRYLHKDDQLGWSRLSASLVRDDAGRPWQVALIAEDITERHHNEQRLREQGTLLDRARDAITVRDLNDRLLYWNQGATRLYGWTEAEALGQVSNELLQSDPETQAAAIVATIEAGEWNGEFDRTTRTGEVVRIEGRWTLMRNEQGEPHSILSINTDVTQRRRLESQYLRSQRIESVGVLAAGIAHDLNNVLAPILMTSWMLRDTEEIPERRDDLSVIESCAQRGANMVRQLLAFARGAAGRHAQLALGAVARDVEQHCRETFPDNIEIIFDVAADLGLVQADASQLQQVLTSLCTNAVEAMPEGGVLRVTLDNTSIDDVDAGMELDVRSGSAIRIEVSDTGRGISPIIADKIFEPFVTTKPMGTGTGLGLSTVHTIVRQHHGMVRFDSVPNHGTTFWIYLPAITADVANLSADTSNAYGEIVTMPKAGGAPPPMGNGEFVLVVDDELAIRGAARRILINSGYRVLLAKHGGEAVELYRERGAEIAVVITDMMMPVLDGPATIAELKRLNPKLPIISSSGLTVSYTVERAMSAGAQSFLPKPYSAELLLQTIHDTLHTPSPT